MCTIRHQIPIDFIVCNIHSLHQSGFKSTSPLIMPQIPHTYSELSKHSPAFSFSSQLVRIHTPTLTRILYIYVRVQCKMYSDS